MNWAKMVQYRADLALWTIALIISPLVSMALWYSVEQDKRVIVYYIFVSFIMTATISWTGFYMAQEILNGDIAKHLVRPFSIFWYHISENIVEKSIRLTIPLVLLLTALFTAPNFFHGAIASGRLIPLAGISILLASCIAFALDTSLGMIAFWLEDAMQIRRYQDLLFQVSSGVLIPYSFMPAKIHTILSILPYRYIISAPAEILSGQASIAQAGKLIGAQLIWILLLFITARNMWKRGLARYAPP